MNRLCEAGIKTCASGTYDKLLLTSTIAVTAATATTSTTGTVTTAAAAAAVAAATTTTATTFYITTIMFVHFSYSVFFLPVPFLPSARIAVNRPVLFRPNSTAYSKGLVVEK